jgi:hypothetical protein
MLLIVIPVVAGSSPVVHPIISISYENIGYHSGCS